MNESYLLSDSSRLESLRQRLLDTASYLRGIAAIVESLNKGAADQMEVAIHAVQAVGNDLIPIMDGYSIDLDAADGAAAHPPQPANAATWVQQSKESAQPIAEARHQLQDVTSRLIELLAARQVGRGGQASMQTAIRDLKTISTSLERLVSEDGVEPVNGAAGYASLNAIGQSAQSHARGPMGLAPPCGKADLSR
jgi:hypothetical protein